MTIIEPKKNKITFNLFLIGLIFSLSLMAFWSVYIYNQTVELGHALSSGEEKLQELKVANADIKNQLYILTDSKNLTKLGEERGLVKIRVPQYFELDNSWSVVSVSQL